MNSQIFFIEKLSDTPLRDDDHIYYLILCFRPILVPLNFWMLLEEFILAQAHIFA